MNVRSARVKRENLRRRRWSVYRGSDGGVGGTVTGRAVVVRSRPPPMPSRSVRDRRRSRTYYALVHTENLDAEKKTCFLFFLSFFLSMSTHRRGHRYTYIYT